MSDTELADIRARVHAWIVTRQQVEALLAEVDRLRSLIDERDAAIGALVSVALKAMKPEGALAAAQAKLESVSDAYIDVLGYMDSP